MNRTTQKDVIGFGALNLDMVFRVRDLRDFLRKLNRKTQVLTVGAEIPGTGVDMDYVLTVLERDGSLRARNGGGQAANTIFALSSMGFDTGYVGKVGNDPEGDLLVESLGSADTSHILRDGRSGIFIGIVDEVGKKSSLVYPNANDEIVYDEIDLAYMKNTKFLHITSFVGGNSLETQKRVVNELSSSTRISFDPNQIQAVRGFRELLPIIQNAYIVFLTEREMEIILNKDFLEGSHELLRYGPRIVVCKRGAEGSYILSRETEHFCPSERIDFADRIGAGDVYASGFLAGLLRGFSLEHCALLATEMASLSITGYGREKYPDREYLRRIEKIIREKTLSGPCAAQSH